jgi:hypothetical protein
MSSGIYFSRRKIDMRYKYNRILKNQKKNLCLLIIAENLRIYFKKKQLIYSQILNKHCLLQKKFQSLGMKPINFYRKRLTGTAKVDSSTM